MALHICRETFTGELAPGVAKTFHAGVDVLDDSQKDQAALLKTFGAFFSEVVSTHLTPPPSEEEVAATKATAKRASKRKANAKAKAAQDAEPEEATPVEEPVVAVETVDTNEEHVPYTEIAPAPITSQSSFQPSVPTEKP
jgi:hypothetical protein